MKRIKLKKWVKVVSTLIIFYIGLKIYTEMGQIPLKAISSIKYQIMLVLGWTWLIIGQIIAVTIIWEEK